MSEPTQPETPAPEPVIEAPDPAPSTEQPAVTNRLAQIAGVRTTDPFGRPRRYKVAIVGFTEHRKFAPFGDPEWEIWGLNELYRYMPADQFTRWFELHDRSDFEKTAQQAGDPEHITVLNRFNVPVFTNAVWPDAPATQVLPKQFIEEHCGTQYFTSSIAWMLGLAIAEGFTTIGVYGVDMAQDTEYVEQKPCCEYLIGKAQGRGIEVLIPKTSDLMKAIGQYGFGREGSEFSAKAIERLGWLTREYETNKGKLAALDEEYTQKKGQLKGQYTALRDNISTVLHQIEGAIDDCKFWKRSWGVNAAAVAGTPPTPDRSLDPKTGITAPRAGMTTMAPVVTQTPSGDGR